MEQNNKMEAHNCTFYYGKQHLLVKSAAFLREGLAQKKKCFYLLEEELKNKLINQFEAEESIFTEFEFNNLLKLINLYLKNGKTVLEKRVEQLIFQAETEGYQGVRILIHPKELITELGEKDFFSWEQAFNQILAEIAEDKISVLCFYDANPLIKEDDDREQKRVLEQALNSHDGLLSAGKVYNIKDEIIVKAN